MREALLLAAITAALCAFTLLRRVPPSAAGATPSAMPAGAPAAAPPVLPCAAAAAPSGALDRGLLAVVRLAFGDESAAGPARARLRGEAAGTAFPSRCALAARRIPATILADRSW